MKPQQAYESMLYVECFAQKYVAYFIALRIVAYRDIAAVCVITWDKET